MVIFLGSEYLYSKIFLSSLSALSIAKLALCIYNFTNISSNYNLEQREYMFQSLFPYFLKSKPLIIHRNTTNKENCMRKAFVGISSFLLLICSVFVQGWMYCPPHAIDNGVFGML